VETLGEVARTHDATVAQVALAYVLRYPNVIAIPGAATADQLAENAAAADLELEEEEYQGLAEAASRCPAPPSRVSRPGLQASKHWIRGSRLLAATMIEDLRLKTVKEP
jgi:diketogulonate reductase-like aldo/keto reductase